MTSPEQGRLAHMVYFTLKDGSPEAVKRLVDSCRKYLTDHAGAEFFAVGTLVGDLDRPVNARDFHVGLHLVFESRAAHDAYQNAPRHQQFIAENKESWAAVRVYDTYLDATPVEEPPPQG